MQSLVLCLSAADADLAGEIRRYLTVNCPSLSVQDDAVVHSPDDLLETLEGALSADLVLLLLSPDAIPAAWPRSQWEPVLIAQPRELGTMLAFLLARPCRFPEVLRKQKFFDLSVDRRGGLRKLKRWLLEQNPLRRDRADLIPTESAAIEITAEMNEELQRRLCDQPTTLSDVARSTAVAFTHAHRADFEGVFWLDCACRSRAGILGDTAHVLGLKLAGPVTQNALALKDFCAGVRCLFIFDRVAREDRQLLTFEGRASVMFTASTETPANALPLAETARLFAAWRGDPALCLRHLGDAQQHLQLLETDCPSEAALTAKHLGASLFSLLQQQERLAEAWEVLEILSKHAWNEGDKTDLRRWEWERGWIREAWGQRAAPPLRLGTTPEPEQLTLAL